MHTGSLFIFKILPHFILPFNVISDLNGASLLGRNHSAERQPPTHNSWQNITALQLDQTEPEPNNYIEWKTVNKDAPPQYSSIAVYKQLSNGFTICEVIIYGHCK